MNKINTFIKSPVVWTNRTYVNKKSKTIELSPYLFDIYKQCDKFTIDSKLELFTPIIALYYFNTVIHNFTHNSLHLKSLHMYFQQQNIKVKLMTL